VLPEPVKNGLAVLEKTGGAYKNHFYTSGFLFHEIQKELANPYITWVLQRLLLLGYSTEAEA